MVQIQYGLYFHSVFYSDLGKEIKVKLNVVNVVFVHA